MESIINQFVNSLPFELHLMDPLVGKYSACGPGTKHKEVPRKRTSAGSVAGNKEKHGVREISLKAWMIWLKEMKICPSKGPCTA